MKKVIIYDLLKHYTIKNFESVDEVRQLISKYAERDDRITNAKAFIKPAHYNHKEKSYNIESIDIYNIGSKALKAQINLYKKTIDYFDKKKLIKTEPLENII